jgi:hypothetical protein
MARSILASWAILGTALVICATGPVLAQAKKSDSEVDLSAAATKPDQTGKQVITVTLLHHKDWHTYANPVGNPDFATNKTVVTVLANGKPIDAKVDYPVGKIVKDKIVGDYKVYENKVDIKATVQRSQGDSTPLEVSVRILACNEKGICLLPATKKIPVR